MLKDHTHSRNIWGAISKFLLPGMVFILLPIITPIRIAQPDFWMQILAIIMLASGIMGMFSSDLLLFRFGDNKVHFSKHPSRLVNLGLYARTRHPYSWSFLLAQAGLAILFWGFSMATLIFVLLLAVLMLGYHYFVSEPKLSRIFGRKFTDYCAETPALAWKIHTRSNQQVKILAQFVWFFSRTLISWWYKIEVRGHENIPHDKPLLIIANHECYLDPFLFVPHLPFEVRFATTADVFTSWWMNLLLKGIGTFPMRRHRQDLKSIRGMIRMVNQGQVVGIFPEGGRSLYGEPLPILKETLKLIQKCQAPLLPVHLDGAYEIWPRWAPNRRRGKVTVHIHPVISVEEQKDLDVLNEKIRSKIFAKEKVFTPVRSRQMSRGLDHVLWACFNCQALNTIRVLDHDHVRCQSCGASWQVTSDYALLDKQGEKISMLDWMHRIESNLLTHRLDKPPDIPLLPDETFYLMSPIRGYQVEDEVIQSGTLKIYLSNQRLLLLKDDALDQSWSYSLITVFTMDYHNAVSIGVGGLRHKFFLPAQEVSLKWQTFFDSLQAEFRTAQQI